MKKTLIPALTCALLLTGCASTAPAAPPKDGSAAATHAAMHYVDAHRKVFKDQPTSIVMPVIKDYCTQVALDGREATNQSYEQDFPESLVTGLQSAARLYCPVSMGNAK